MIEARIRGLRLWLFSKFYWEMELRKLISARIRRCRSCSKLFLSFHDFDTCFQCDVNEYAEFIREDLRAMPYTEYLKTSHWRHVRLHALDRARYRCQLCNSPKRLEVHHRTYENLGCEEPEDLTALCHKCHKHFHLGE